jgi:hypothetical protein
MGSSRIRLYSRLAALALAALVVAGILALRVRRAEEHFGSLTITSYIVADAAPHHETPPLRKPPPEAPIRAVAAGYLGAPSSNPPPRLWTYSATGDIVFDRPDQYRRCVAARAAHHNEADCPEPHDAHPLVLRPG